MQFKVGDQVRWTSSNTVKVGAIVALVPIGDTPQDTSYPKAGGGGIKRDHLSYIVKGKKRYDHNDQEYGSASVYWPIVSLLKPA